MATKILIARHELRGGVKKKDGTVERWVIAPGETVPATATPIHKTAAPAA